MSHYNTLFGHLLAQLPRHQFENLVSKYQGDRYSKKLSTWNQFQVLLYAQSGGHQSLRDIETGMLGQGNSLYHLGLPDKICRNTLSHANSRRDWRIYHEFFYKLLSRCVTSQVSGPPTVPRNRTPSPDPTSFYLFRTFGFGAVSTSSALKDGSVILSLSR